jgi:RNA recognition motif-containing protein
VRINVAQRKNSVPPPGSGIGSSTGGSYYGQPQESSQTPSYGQSSVTGSSQYGQQPPPPLPGPPGQINGVLDINSVRDDRGNGATKNLFVAGYGNGTTEAQLRQLFSAYGHIVSIMMKANFSFVNTNDRAVAVAAREGLMGYEVNGYVQNLVRSHRPLLSETSLKHVADNFFCFAP